MGVMPDEAADLVRRIRQAPQLRMTGIYSHFATADFELLDLVERQLGAFNGLISQLGDLLPAGTLRHIANSAATITLPEAHLDMVRPGLALYGQWPARHMAERIDLRPILRLSSHVSLIKELPAGHCVGYGQSFTTPRPTRLGIVPIGYHDGYVRALSNTAVVTIRGASAPVIGRVSMDQMAIDLTEIPAARICDEVTLIDDRPERPNCMAAIAERLGTIPYEVMCLLGRRIERISVGGPCAPSGLGPVAKPRLEDGPMCRTA
jgi:alanine racemase